MLYLDEEDAFWTLIAIVEVFMPRDYYTKTLLGSQVNRLKWYILAADGMRTSYFLLIGVYRFLWCHILVTEAAADD